MLVRAVAGSRVGSLRAAVAAPSLVKQVAPPRPRAREARCLVPVIARRAYSQPPSSSSTTPPTPPPKEVDEAPLSTQIRRLELQLASLRRVLGQRLADSAFLASSRRLSRGRRWGYVFLGVGGTVLVLGTLSAYDMAPGGVRKVFIGTERCTRVAVAVGLCIWDYKALFRRWPEFHEHEEDRKKRRHDDYEATHLRCAERIRDVLIANGGVYIKFGQHLSSVALIPTAWTKTMIPLQDQCRPSSVASISAYFEREIGVPLAVMFSSFDAVPLGVASLAQVHTAVERESGRKVAIKLLHPGIEEFAGVDMWITVKLLGVVKAMFPSFEFTWLGEEMEQNLPLEMDFRHEAANANRARADFAGLKSTSIVVPEVIWAKKRIMVMEYISGARPDNLEFLAEHNIDRNKVAQELSAIMSRMIYVNGFFHADPHGGNMLVRPAQEGTRSPYNFEIALLDHGLYFDLPSPLKENYAHLWLALIATPSEQVEKDRRKYAYLAGNIDDDLYPIFQAAITGRAALAGSTTDGDTVNRKENEHPRAGSMMHLGEQGKDEIQRIRRAVTEQEGMLESVFELLRRVPRRMLMVLKVNDLTRAVDANLHTTHGPARIFLIVADYCNLAVYLSDRSAHRLRRQAASSLLSLSLWGSYVRFWWRYQTLRAQLSVAEWAMDIGGEARKWRDWARGVRQGGWSKGWEEWEGIAQAKEDKRGEQPHLS